MRHTSALITASSPLFIYKLFIEVFCDVPFVEQTALKVTAISVTKAVYLLVLLWYKKVIKLFDRVSIIVKGW